MAKKSKRVDDEVTLNPSQPGGVRALTPGETVTFNWRSVSSNPPVLRGTKRCR